MRLPVIAALLLGLSTTACAVGTAAHENTTSTDPAASCGPSTVRIGADTIDPVTPPPHPKLPVTLTGADGRKVTVRDTSRILAVNMYGSLAEIVFSLGAGGQVVGRDVSTTFPAASRLPLVTTEGHDLSAEAILKLNPSVILTDASIGSATVLSQLRQAGIPVVMIDEAQTLAGISLHITQVAAALGIPAAGRTLDRRVTAQIAAAHQAPATALRIAFLYVRGSAGVYLIGGRGAGSDAMIEAIGGTDAGSALGLSGFRPLTSEGMINAAPDVILVMTDGLASVGGVAGLLKLPGVAQTPAGEHRRIVAAPDGVLLNFGADTGATIAALAAAVYHPCAS